MSFYGFLAFSASDKKSAINYIFCFFVCNQSFYFYSYSIFLLLAFSSLCIVYVCVYSTWVFQAFWIWGLISCSKFGASAAVFFLQIFFYFMLSTGTPHYKHIGALDILQVFFYFGPFSLFFRLNNYWIIFMVLDSFAISNVLLSIYNEVSISVIILLNSVLSLYCFYFFEILHMLRHYCHIFLWFFKYFPVFLFSNQMQFKEANLHHWSFFF